MKVTSSCLVICLAYAIICLTNTANGRPHPEYVISKPRFSSRRSESNSADSSDSDSKSSSSEVDPCLPGWVLNDTSCYYFSESIKTWEGAREACLNLSMNAGHLIDIYDQKEQDFVNSQMQYRNGFWIGLNDIEKESEFVWVDTNRSVSFTFWQDGFNSYEASLDCVYIYYVADMVFHPSEGWNVGPCGVDGPYICEMDAVFK